MVVILVPGLLTTDMIVGGWSIAHALGMATAWVGGWIVLTQASADRSWQVIALAAALGGAVSAYFDLMVAIPASLALCTAAPGWRRCRRSGGSTRPWSARWRWRSADGRSGSARCGRRNGHWPGCSSTVNASSTVSATRSRSAPAASTKGCRTTRLTGFTKNVSYWIDRPLTPLVVIAAVVVLGALGWRSRYRFDWSAAGWVGVAVAAVTLPVVVWFIGPQQPQPDPLLADVPVPGDCLRSRRRRGDRRRHRHLQRYSDDRSAARYAHGNGDDEAITSEPSEEQDVPQAISP